MRRPVLFAFLVLIVAACSSDDGASTSTTRGSTTSASAAPSGSDGYEATVEALAADVMEGRDNQTPGSALAQDHLVGQLEELSEPVGGSFRHAFAEGTNILGLIPGAELPDEYVILGAHYDHLGRECFTSTLGDGVCNGAADNAAGVAAVLEIGRRLAADGPPRRSVVLAFWDAEEDGLLGSTAYVADPPIPLEQTIAYLNWDILGVNLLPSLANVTVLVGAETGGPALVEAADRATAASDLDTLALSLLFGQGRSDHAVFAGAGVPTVFFTDASSACYHTSQDDTSVLDFDKLGQQIATGEALARDLVATEGPPTFVVDLPTATYEDAGSMLEVVRKSQPDLGRFSAQRQATAAQFLIDLEAMRDAGPAAFDARAVDTLLTGSVEVVSLLTDGDCEGYLG